MSCGRFTTPSAVRPGVLRGESSDVLTRETAHEMTERGPHAQVVEIPGVGHAPMLLDEAQIAHAREFLLAA